MNKQIVVTALRAVGLAMGVAVIVLSTFGTITSDTGISLLALGLSALALAALQ